MRPVEIKVELYNSETNNPLENDGQWTLKSWGTGTISDVRNAGEYIVWGEGDPPKAPTVGLRSKLRAGTAFWVHLGDNEYRLTSTYPNGIFLWEHPTADMGAKTYSDRQKDAEACLAEYSAWAHGEVYGYTIECEETGFEDSCGGFVGSDYFLDEVRDRIQDCMREFELVEDDVEFALKGDAAWLWDYMPSLTPMPFGLSA